MFEKLQADYERFQELEAALLDPAAAGDPARLPGLAKERGALAKVSLPYAKYLDLTRQIDENTAFAKAETDPEMEVVLRARASKRLGPSMPKLATPFAT